MSKIFYADDEHLLLKVFTKRFIDEGFEVDSASDGEEALTKITKFKPDVVLLDVKMPKLSGMDVLEKLKKDNATKHIPVVILTNQSMEKADLDSAYNMGAIAYLVKTDTTLDELVKKVKAILAENSDHAEIVSESS